MISIVIPAHNAEKSIARCLDGLNQQTHRRDDCEIIVVDDGSTDATADVARLRQARVLEQSNQGAAAARNLGVRNARGDMVLFIDSDCEPDPNWVSAMIAPFSDDAVVGSGGMKQTRQHGLIPRFIQAEFDDRYDKVRTHRYIDFVDSGTAAYRRQVFLQSGGFDTRLFDAEDVELSFRLSEQSFKLAFAVGAVVYCEHPSSAWDYLRRKFTYAYWRSFVYRRFPQKIASDSRTPQTQKIQSGLALLLPISILATFFSTQFAIVPIIILILLVGTTVPFILRYVTHDWKIALIAPVLIPLAAFAVGSGIAIGALSNQFFTNVSPRRASAKD